MEYNIIWKIRFPRILMAAILGGALALSGFLLQTFFGNPIAGPFVLGISSGAKMTVALAMICFLKNAGTVSSYGLILAAFAGPVSFVGIAVPFLIKRGLGTAKPLFVIPGVFLGGAVFCMLCDLIARMAFAPTEMSISAVTSLLGAPVVIYMIIRQRRES